MPLNCFSSNLNYISKEIFILQRIAKSTHKKEEVHWLGIVPRNGNAKIKNSLKVFFIQKPLESARFTSSTATVEHVLNST